MSEKWRDALILAFGLALFGNFLVHLLDRLRQLLGIQAAVKRIASARKRK
ncbi:hypothetical protein ACQ4M3_12110 [Leptolyngbya sp. AN03gr2]